MILVKSEKAAERVMTSITTFIEKKLGLIVNATKIKVAKPNEIKYLGSRFYKNKQGQYRPKPHIKSIEKFKRKLKLLLCRSWSVKLDLRLLKFKQLIQGRNILIISLYSI